MKNSQIKSAGGSPLVKEFDRCLYCGMPAQLVWVHGHGQCSSCGTNVDECCRGESCVTKDGKG
ncbi:MAG: hypothetical protein WD008_02325 [Balneolaceae bacterium]